MQDVRARSEPRVAPGSRAVGNIRLILLATDLSPASDGAAAQALALAHDLGADVLVMSAIDPRSILADGLARRVDRIRLARELAAQGLVAKGRELGVGVSFLIWDGPAGEAIVEVATNEQVDMVVVGSHGRGERVGARCPARALPGARRPGLIRYRV